MTVGIAALCGWRKPDGKPGTAVITASDRMITRRGEVEYEPPQAKIGRLTDHAIVLWAGDAVVHSEAILKSKKELEGSIDDVGVVAELYGAFVREFRLRENTQAYLAPAGLTRHDLMSGKDNQLATHLAAQMQENAPDAEALVVGSTKTGEAHIYYVDNRGFVTCHDEIGFMAIGAGAPHAESQIMASKYATWWNYAQTALLVYSAKKRAEVSPGVGPETDMGFISYDGIAPLLQRNRDKIEAIYERWRKQESERHEKGVRELVEFMRKKEQEDQAAKEANSSKDQT